MIIRTFKEQVRRNPAKVAVTSGTHSLTYQYLDTLSDQLAHTLSGGTEHTAALLLGQDESMITGILAALKSGKVYIPFDPSYPEERLVYMLRDSGAGLMVTNHACHELAVRLSKRLHGTGEQGPQITRIINLDDAIKGNKPTERARALKTAEAKPHQAAYILYTSGSTGRPKGVVQTQENILYYLKEWTNRFSLTENDRMVQFASFCHDGSVPDIYGALLNGASLFIFSVKDRANIEPPHRWLIREDITIWHSVPTWFRYVVNGLDPGISFPRLRLVILGGEAVREHDLKLFNTHFPASAFGNIYGQTESTVSSIWLVSPGEPFHHVLIGQTIGQTEILLVDSEGDEVDELDSGELVLAGSFLSPGYLNLPEATHDAFGSDEELGHLYWTGDLGRLLPHGNIEILGRKDNQVKVRGFRIEPGEIESALLNHPVVDEAVVVSKEGTGNRSSTYGAVSGDHFLQAYIVMNRTLTIHELREHLSSRLPDYMIPAVFLELEAMPLTPGGKIDRKSLDAHAAKLDTGSAYAPPGNETEELLATLWKKALKRDKVGIDDNFFDLGGNSMDVIALNDELKTHFQRTIPVAAIFRYLTIRSFAAFLDGEKKKNRKTAEPVNKSTPAHSGRGRDIAVIGMAGRFPGANTIETFWENLKNGIETISFFSEAELIDAGIPAEIVSQPDYVKVQPLLEDIQYFDAGFFGYIPAEAAVMDPQMRVFHECVYHALEDGGYDPYSYDGSIGLFAGASVNLNWMALHMAGEHTNDAGLFEARQLFDKEFLCLRISHKLNLRGPAVSVQTSCSTSLVAIHMACRSLYDNECDIALAGGVSIPYMTKSGHIYSAGSIFSSDGHCKVFDAASDGTVFGNGAGVVALKKWADAEADNDNIHALIRGSFINNDGIDRGGFTTPGASGESRVIRSALDAAEIDPESIGYIETHSTGTTLGGPIEIDALTRAFNTSKKQFCALGNVKTNLGHLNMASGVTGFIKTVLCLKHGLIPPVLHFRKPDPAIDFANSPFFINTVLRTWDTNGKPRRAGVNSFGIGGTNAHVILESTPQKKPVETEIYHSPHDTSSEQLIVLSAQTPGALERMTVNLADFLRANPGLNMKDAAFTLMKGRRACRHRRMMVCSNSEEGAAKLMSTVPGKTHTAQAPENEPPVIFMFSGLGGQHKDMGRELYQTQPVFRAAIDRCNAQLTQLKDCEPLPGCEQPVIPVQGDPADESPVTQDFETAQVMVFRYEYAMAQLLMDWGIEPYAMTGYSFGEIVTACVSGVLSLKDSLRLIYLRGQLIAGLDAGAMLSVPMPLTEVKGLIETYPALSIAIDNGPSTVVGGPENQIQLFEKAMKTQHLICMRIQSTRALHSQMMEPILDEFNRRLSVLKMNPPDIPYVSNVSGNWIHSNDIKDAGYWARHLSGTVRFAEGIQALIRKLPKRAVFVEIGPGRELTTLIQRHIEDRPGFTAVSTHSGLLSRIGRLWLRGVNVDWQKLFTGTVPTRLSLPKYPFERQAFPITGDLLVKAASLVNDNHPAAGSASVKVNSDNAQQNSKPDELQTVSPAAVRPDIDCEYVEPRGGLERNIAKVWETFFGFEPVGANDDFFELGGDSLKVLIVIKEMYDALGAEINMDAFFKQPTVAGAAAIIRAGTAQQTENAGKSHLFDSGRLIEGPMIHLNPERSAAENHTLFCFPSALAHGMIFKSLAESLHEYAVYSFNFIEEDDRLNRYIELVTGCQPNGPYVLFSYSAGAKLTFEAAATLEDHGFEVSDIILVDCLWPRRPIPEEVPEAVIYNIEQYLGKLGAETYKERIIRRVANYRRYYLEDSLPKKIHAHVHVILSDENKDTPLKKCWDPFTTKGSSTYQGQGKHDEMLHPANVGFNAAIIQHILKGLHPRGLHPRR